MDVDTFEECVGACRWFARFVVANVLDFIYETCGTFCESEPSEDESHRVDVRLILVESSVRANVVVEKVLGEMEVEGSSRAVVREYPAVNG